MHSNLSLIYDIAHWQMHHPQLFDLLAGSLNCPFTRGSTNLSFVTGIDSPLIVLRCARSISPHNPLTIHCRLIVLKSNSPLLLRAVEPNLETSLRIHGHELLIRIVVSGASQ
jgi:hypothetical protein